MGPTAQGLICFDKRHGTNVNWSNCMLWVLEFQHICEMVVVVLMIVVVAIE